MPFIDEMEAYDIYLRLEFARSDLEDILEKYKEEFSLDETGIDLQMWIQDTSERILEIEREVVVEYPSIREYVDEDVR